MTTYILTLLIYLAPWTISHPIFYGYTIYQILKRHTRVYKPEGIVIATILAFGAHGTIESIQQISWALIIPCTWMIHKQLHIRDYLNATLIVLVEGIIRQISGNSIYGSDRLITSAGDWATMGAIIVSLVPYAITKKHWLWIILAGSVVISGGSRSAIALYVFGVASSLSLWLGLILFTVALSISSIHHEYTAGFWNGRLGMWRHALENTQWFGNFGIYQYGYTWHPHNQYLSVLYDYGIGSVSWLWYWLKRIKGIYYYVKPVFIITIINIVLYGLVNTYNYGELYGISIILATFNSKGKRGTGAFRRWTND